VRLRPNRKSFRRPGPHRGRGPRPKHGPVLKLPDPTTHGTPDRRAGLDDPIHGRVRVDAWQRVHGQAAADAPFTLVRIRVERLPRHPKRPEPPWLAWLGGPRPADRLDRWRWYTRRCVIEHGFGILKHDLGRPAVRPLHPAAADRWSWLLVLGLWMPWPTRPLVADQRLPRERPRPPARPTPARVRRARGPLLVRVGTPARPVQPRGNAPGRRPGRRPRPHPRQPVTRRPPQRAASRKERPTRLSNHQSLSPAKDLTAACRNGL